MAIQQKLGLSTRLSQRLILTPSLQQAIKLLPLTTLELAEVLEQEVMENPLLEEVPVEETMSTDQIAQEEAKDAAERVDPLQDIDVDKFFEDYLDDRDQRRTRTADIPEMPPLYALEPGDTAVVAVPGSTDPEIVEFLGTLGLRPGVRVEVKEKHPFDGPLVLRVDGKDRTLGATVANQVFVQRSA